MKELTLIQRIVFLVGGALMVVGAGTYVFMWHQQVFGWIFLLGAFLFSTVQFMQTYSGASMTVKRLKRIMNLANLLFVLAGLLMVDNAFGVLRPLFSDVTDYLNYVYNKWVLLLLIAALLELYTTHRIFSELGKDQKAKK
ncbi:hypothetical protein HMPREF9135_1459 [Segatella baroniae F0067]|uniref:Uncharacterized protein n=1 Tax=Segatella baroniae F0067 TaxID=1115809 RepID=U2QIA8_9BACT|nr:hypothetical protein [Segatella baroniae]ERK38547.1 hypothetical protein HMPREF9135_1459 [Segatella baroniae F0067]